MNDELLKELDDDSLMGLLQTLEELDKECENIINQGEGVSNE